PRVADLRSRPQTYEAYGVSYAESRERFREILDIVERAWTETGFSYQGKYQRFKNVAVVPRPYQKPKPPIRIAASTSDIFPAIGREARRSLPRCVTPAGPPSPSRSAAITKPGRRRAIPARSSLRLGSDLSCRNRQCRACEPRASIMHFYHEQASLLEGVAKFVDAETTARRMRRVEQLR